MVADRLEDIKTSLEIADRRSRVVVITGGLGPTPDDLTRDAIAEFFGFELAEDADLLAHVQALFRARGMEMPETSRNQALFPVGATQIPNPHGTASGIYVERNGRHFFVLPGVSIETQQMIEQSVLPILKAAFPEALRLTRTLRLAGIGESHLLRELGDQIPIQRLVALAYLPHHGLLDIRLNALSADLHEAEAQIAEAESYIREQVGEYVYGTGSDTLAKVIGNILQNRGQWLAVAESCTGGLVSSMITDTPGSSRWFNRGWVTYSNTAKYENLGVPVELLEKNGAVSEAVARAMAEGARAKADADWGLATTGIAGPDGGTAEKPVGTVWMAVSSKEHTASRHLQFSGLRETIKLRTAHTALTYLYRQLMDDLQ